MTSANLFLLGPPKTASTTVFHALRGTDGVFTAPLKEPQFYLLRDGRRFSGPGSTEFHRMAVSQRTEYQELYRNGAAARWRLDASTLYLHSPAALEGIERTVSDPRFIVSLRDPVERAVSAWAHLRRDGHETLQFGPALAAETERRERGWMPLFRYEAHSRYAPALSGVVRRFGRARLLIITSSALRRDPAGTARRLSDFLDVEVEADVFRTQYNVSGRPRSELIHRLLNKPSRWRAALRDVAPPWVHKALVATRSRNLGPAEEPGPDALARLRAATANEMTDVADVVGERVSFSDETA